MGSPGERLEASIAGGASILNLPTSEIGKRNEIFVRKFLDAAGIPIIAEDVGGAFSRTARFDLSDGKLFVTAKRRPLTGNKDFFNK